MQTSKMLVLVVISVLAVAVLASADKLGVANSERISFSGNDR